MLDDEFIQYCKLNKIEDIQKFAKQVFDKGFMQVKYGNNQPSMKKDEIIAKWQKAGFLDELTSENFNPAVEKLLEPNEVQKIEEPKKIKQTKKKKEKDIYDE